MIMATTMALGTKGYSIRDSVPKFGMGSERLDVVRVKSDGLSVSAALAAILACVIVSVINGLAPAFVFVRSAGDSVLVRLVYVAFPPGFLSALRLFTCSRMSKFRTTSRAELACTATFYKLRHRLFAYRAGGRYVLAIGAKLIKGINVLAALPAHLARLSDAACARLVSSGTGQAGRVFGGLSHDGDGGCHLSAGGTRLNVGLVAGWANAVLPAICLTVNTSVFSHDAIISQLPYCEANYGM